MFGNKSEPPASKFLLILGANVRTARKERQWSQRKLADKAHLRQATIANLENGKTNPTIDTLLMISGALEIPLIQLIPLPWEQRVREDELDDWMREGLAQMKYIENEDTQRAIIAMLRTFADQEIRQANEQLAEDLDLPVDDED